MIWIDVLRLDLSGYKYTMFSASGWPAKARFDVFLYFCTIKNPDIVLSSDLGSAAGNAFDGYLLHAFCRQGSCRFIYNERPFELHAGDCMIMPRHGDRMRDIQPDEDFAIDIIYVTEAFINVATPQSNYGMRGGLALFDNPVMRLDEEQQQICALNFDYIRKRLAFDKHLFHRDAMINAVQCMIIDFYDFHAKNYGVVHITSPNARLMEQFQMLLDRGDFRQHRNVGYYADILCVSPKYLSEVSLKVSGEPASHWISRYTALEISRMLRNQALSIEEISDLFGFSSLSYFHRYVQKNLGVAPSTFRE
ncbi:MAG: helix-turn-helix domain-containing protein [bacterium P3]|nr:MAG: helix-turn-helix domain-containing protein [bacterium P3]KWW39029.1 MAG: helix-turn-helix domain-containing protein [bacterium F083]